MRPATVPINKPLVLSVKGADLKWKIHIVEKKSQQEKCDVEREKKVLNSESKDINSKIEDITKSCEILHEFLDYFMQAEKKNDMHFVIKGNSLKRTSDVKKQNIQKTWAIMVWKYFSACLIHHK